MTNDEAIALGYSDYQIFCGRHNPTYNVKVYIPGELVERTIKVLAESEESAAKVAKRKFSLAGPVSVKLVKGPSKPEGRD